MPVNKGSETDKPGSPNERLYICPRYWDRKHQIPLSPKNEEHPILKDKEGNPLPYGGKNGWKKHIVPHTLTTKQLKDSEYFIFERKGQGKGKDKKDSYWYSSGEDIDAYNVIFKQNCHPRFPIPCCGKKKITDKYSVGENVIVFEKKGITYNGKIIKPLSNDNYKIDIPGIGKKTYHISKLKLNKVTYNYSSVNNFPLFEGEKGMVNKDILDFLNIDFNIKIDKCGLFRNGIQQDNDSFLKCLTDKPLSEFKNELCNEIDSMKNVGSLNNLIELFRNKEILIDPLKETKENLKNYIKSDEYKNSYLLTSLIKEITKRNNKLFNNKFLNIVVFLEKDNKIVIEKPINGFDYRETDSYKLLFKKDKYYESIEIVSEEDNSFSEFIKQEDNELNVGTKILVKNLNSIITDINEDKITYEIIRDNDKDTFSKKSFLKNKNKLDTILLDIRTEKDNLSKLNKEKQPLNKDKFKKYIQEKLKLETKIEKKENEKNEIIKSQLCEIMFFENIIIDKLILHTSKILNSGNKEFLDYQTLINIMNYELNITKTENEYIDNNYRISHLEFEIDKQKLYIPIKPKCINYNNKYISNSKIDKIDYKLILTTLKKIDKYIDDTIHLKYIEDKNYEITENYLIFDNKSFIPILKTDNRNLDNMIEIPKKIRGKIKENSLTEYMEKYYENEIKEYEADILLLFYLRKKKSKLKKVNNIINHDIMPKIDKREKIYKILKKNKENIEDKYIFFFIEKLLIHGYSVLQNKLINNVSIKDITKPNLNEYIFKFFQIKNKDYSYIFGNIYPDSNFMRNNKILPYL